MVEIPTIAVRPSEVGIEAYRLVKVLQRPCELPCVHIMGPSSVVGIDRVRIEKYRRVQITNGGVYLAHSRVCQRATDESRGIAGVKFNRGVQVPNDLIVLVHAAIGVRPTGESIHVLGVSAE